MLGEWVWFEEAIMTIPHLDWQTEHYEEKVRGSKTGKESVGRGLEWALPLDGKDYEDVAGHSQGEGEAKMKNK